MEPYEPHYYEYARERGGALTFPSNEAVAYLNRALAGKASRLLEIGCGTGELIRSLDGGIDYTGLELSQFAVDQAAARQGESARSRFIAGDAANLPFDDSSFDAVAMFFMLEHVKDPRRVLREAMRVLRPQGHLVVTAPNLEFPFAFPSALRHRPLPEKIGFRVLHAWHYALRILSISSFHVIRHNFADDTGTYEKKDDDLRHIVSSWEVANFLEQHGMALAQCWREKDLHGWRRFARHLPRLGWYGTSLAAAFKKI